MAGQTKGHQWPNDSGISGLNGLQASLESRKHWRTAFTWPDTHLFLKVSIILLELQHYLKYVNMLLDRV